jgi:acid phosphatase type 7
MTDSIAAHALATRLLAAGPSRPLVLALAVLLVLLAWPALARADTNLLPNGDFEGDGSGSLAHWAATSATLALAADGAGGGHAGLATAKSGAAFGFRATPTPVRKATGAGTEYTAGGRLRSDQPGHKVCLRLVELSSAGKTVASRRGCATTQTTWSALPQVRLTAKQSGGSIAYRVAQLGTAAGATFELDDLTFTSSAAAPPAAPAPPSNLTAVAVSSSEIDLSWDASPTSGLSGYRVERDGSPVATVAASAVSYHDTGLAAGSTHSYVVRALAADGTASAPSNTAQATTTAGGGGGGGAVVLGAVGDMACDPSSSGWNGGNGLTARCGERRASDAVMADSSLQGILGLGDYQYECGDPSDYALSYTPTWGRLNALMRPVAGNHEYKTGPDKWGDPCPATNVTAQTYFSYFGAASHPSTAGHFSFDLGSWHLIALNGNCGKQGVGSCGASGPQAQWLAADLAANTKPCILAYWHQPRWTGTPRNQTAYQAWWDLLYQHHADLVLNGHIHNYSRFGQLDASGHPSTDGIREVIVGTGGEDLGGGTLSASPAAQVLIKRFGYLRLSLGSSGYDGTFVDYTGADLDRFSGSCH